MQYLTFCGYKSNKSEGGTFFPIFRICFLLDCNTAAPLSTSENAVDDVEKADVTKLCECCEMLHFQHRIIQTELALRKTKCIASEHVTVHGQRVPELVLPSEHVVTKLGRLPWEFLLGPLNVLKR